MSAKHWKSLQFNLKVNFSFPSRNTMGIIIQHQVETNVKTSATTNRKKQHPRNYMFVLVLLWLCLLWFSIGSEKIMISRIIAWHESHRAKKRTARVCDTESVCGFILNWCRIGNGGKSTALPSKPRDIERDSTTFFVIPSFSINMVCGLSLTHFPQHFVFLLRLMR